MKKEYYQLAENLMRSYHLFYKTPLLLAILAEQKNVYPDRFDDVSIFSN